MVGQLENLSHVMISYECSALSVGKANRDQVCQICMCVEENSSVQSWVQMIAQVHFPQ